ncbi:MAG TPA: acetolactate synthase small subunit [Ktedonobacteraceae bacterium]|jgi:acetolactate synthase I/III small subunit|nr:acetolactate synthase small subunit [Ktedonobacteraceae bacterium]
MTNPSAPTHRSGHSDAPQGTERTHMLIVLVHDRPGAVDRVVGVLRRRRANMQTFVLGRTELPETVRVTVSVTDSEVGLDHLIEQLRKTVDVRQVINLTYQQAITRELALIKVNSSAEHPSEIIELGSLFGAAVVDLTPDTITLEVTGSGEKIEKLVSLLQEYGIREVARSGSVAMARGT